MSDERKRFSWWTVAAVVVVLLPLYVLSVGPAYWLYLNDYISFETLSAVYAPVQWGAIRFSWFGNLLTRYSELFM